MISQESYKERKSGRSPEGGQKKARRRPEEGQKKAGRRPEGRNAIETEPSCRLILYSML